MKREVINFYKKLCKNKHFSIKNKNGFFICGQLDITQGKALNSLVIEKLKELK